VRISLQVAGLALIQAGLVVALGWTVGDAVLRRTVARADRVPEAIGLPERALFALCGFVALAIALMVAHIATGGAVFGTWAVVPVVGAVIGAVGIRRRAWPRHVPWRSVVVAIVVLFAFFVLPVVRGGTSVRTGDTPWHLGWSEQLLDGEPVPTGPAPEYGRNAYPWGFHAVVATMVRLVPGTDPLIAHEAIHLLIVLAIPLTAACIARRVNPRAGWAAAAAAALIGGFGWLSARDPYFILSPSLSRYGADLVVASPNSMYELFPPALPRELGLVLLGAAAVAMSLATMIRGRPAWILAGGLVGIGGLVSVPIFVMGLVWIVCGALILARGRRIRSAATMLAAALSLFALWVGPVVANYIRFEGFVNVTPELGVEWPLGSALWSWGLLLPAALIGLLLTLRDRRPSVRVIVALFFGSVALLGVAIARGEFSWDLGGNETVLHQGRMWPVVHLLAAAFAGVALVVVFRFLASRSKAIAAAAAAGFLALGAASPAVASAYLTTVISAHDAGYLYRRPDFDDDAFVVRAARELDSSDVVAVEGSDFLGLMLFSLSGARLAHYDDDRLPHNDLRIRYESLARRWDERMGAGGFPADYVVMRASEASTQVDPVASGTFRDEKWVMVVAAES
jgi:hypothetical protein